MTKLREREQIPYFLWKTTHRILDNYCSVDGISPYRGGGPYYNSDLTVEVKNRLISILCDPIERKLEEHLHKLEVD